MIIVGNGFLAYHVEVGVGEGQAAAVKAAVSEWEDELRQAGTWPDFPGGMVDRLLALPAVTQVVCEGPQSSVLIPLRMARGITGLPVTLSSVLGTGPITRAIESDLQRWGVSLECVGRLPDADAPLEFSFRAPDGRHESLRLYPASRKKYRANIGNLAVFPTHLVLNRYNKGLYQIAERVFQQGGMVSFRPREMGRYDRIEDYVSLLPLTTQLVLSSRHDIIRKLVKHAGIPLPRKWPGSISSLADDTGLALGQWLLERLPASAVVMFHLYPSGDSAFYRQGCDPVLVKVPEGYDEASRAARIQGALLGNRLLPQGKSKDWDDWCRHVIDTAFRGTEGRPWGYF